MANPNNPFGFEVLKVDGKECRVREYKKDTSAALYPGDVVKLASDGEVEVAATSGAILGVAAEYKAASADKICVYDDPEIEFIVQAAGGFAAADVGLNANIVANAADTTLKQSNHSLNTNAAATTDTYQFKILGLFDRGVNAVGSYAIVRVKPNQHAFKLGVTGV